MLLYTMQTQTKTSKRLNECMWFVQCSVHKRSIAMGPIHISRRRKKYAKMKNENRR